MGEKAASTGLRPAPAVEPRAAGARMLGVTGDSFDPL